MFSGNLCSLRCRMLMRDSHLSSGKNLPTQSKINEFDCSTFVVKQHHVFRLKNTDRDKNVNCTLFRCWEPHLEVEVRGVVGVEVLHPQQHLLDEEARLLLRQSLPLSDEVEQLAAPEPAQGVMCNAEFIVARMCVNSLLQSDSGRHYVYWTARAVCREFKPRHIRSGQLFLLLIKFIFI